MCDALQINWKLPSSSANTILGGTTKKEFFRRSDANNNNNSNGGSGNALKRSSNSFSKKMEDSKYTLRACSIQKRIETESRKGQPRKRGPKPRPKPLPMSKYRRKTANQRERQRMGEINVAFDKLRDKIPSPSSRKGRCEKITKINILHVAINYIRALESILDTGEPGVQVYGTSLIRGPLAAENKTSSASPSSTASSSSHCSGSPHSPHSPVGGEASEDSGIMDEDEELYPDWTELTSTLDFPGIHGKIVHKDISLHHPSLHHSNSLTHQGSRGPHRAPSTLNLSDFLAQGSNESLSSSSGTTPEKQQPPEEESSLFTDLNSSFESISEGLVDFSHEDPFENLFF